jgi:hypothetical protein
MDDRSLMAKYRLSVQGLQTLFKELADAGLLKPGERQELPLKISLREIVSDLQSGASRFELMERYGLNSKGLYQLFKQLVEVGAIEPSALYSELASPYQTFIPENARELRRRPITFDLAVYEANNPKMAGKIRDITEKGIGTVGIEAVVGEVKHLVILLENFQGATPIFFEAECRWARMDPETKKRLAGFRITDISPQFLEQLRRLMEWLVEQEESEP